MLALSLSLLCSGFSSCLFSVSLVSVAEGSSVSLCKGLLDREGFEDVEGEEEDELELELEMDLESLSSPTATLSFWLSSSVVSTTSSRTASGGLLNSWLSKSSETSTGSI